MAGIPVHLYWALGGNWGLPSGAATAGLPGLRAVNLAVSVLLACGAAFLCGLTGHGRASRQPSSCQLAHPAGARVAVDNTAATPVLTQVLSRIFVRQEHQPAGYADH